eukprot:scaffold30492_cov47-Attheya_sp.AAC.5
MANVTDPLARAVHGTNPQNLIEYITRQKIYDSRYWKEDCFGLSAADVARKSVTQLQAIGGSYGGNNAPTRFLCLALKLLQIQPDDSVVDELLGNEDFKYVRALGAFYLRLTGRPADIYAKLEPLYNDDRPLRRRETTGWSLVAVDEFIDELLRNDRSPSLPAPNVPKNWLTRKPSSNNSRHPTTIIITQTIGNGILTEAPIIRGRHMDQILSESVRNNSKIEWRGLINDRVRARALEVGGDGRQKSKAKFANGKQNDVRGQLIMRMLEDMLFRGSVVTMIRMRMIEMKDGGSVMERAGTVIIIIGQIEIEIENMVVTANDRKRTVPHRKRTRSMDPSLKKKSHHHRRPSTSSDLPLGAMTNQKEEGTTYRGKKRPPRQRKEVTSTGMQNVPN